MTPKQIVIPVYFNIAQLAIISEALQEWQGDFEAAINGATIADIHDINQLLDYNIVSVECEAARLQIENTLEVFRKD